MKLRSIKLLLACVLSASIALAHHSFAAEYDGDKYVTMKGTVVKVDWQNPHMFFYMDVATANGQVEHWKFEGFPPNMLVRQGWKKDETMKQGDRITVSGWLARSGEKLAHSREITWETDGRKLLSGPPAGTGGN
jgi:hypothetical protein